MAPDDHRSWREQLGAYALDQLDADASAAVRAHVDGCVGCRAELAPVVRRLSVGDAERVASSPAPPRDLGDRVVARVGRERRARRARRRRTAVRASSAAAAAVAAAVAALALAAALPRSDAVEVGLRAGRWTYAAPLR